MKSYRSILLELGLAIYKLVVMTYILALECVKLVARNSCRISVHTFRIVESRID